MEINKIDIKTFGESQRYEEPRLEPRGKTHVIHGRNKVGKSLTFSAVSHCLTSERWGKTAGNGARVETRFSDGTEYDANSSGHVLTTPGGEEFEAGMARKERGERLSGLPFREYFFFPSEVSDLPLSKTGEDEVMNLVRRAVAPEKYDEIDRLRGKKDDKKDEIRDLEGERSSTETSLERYRSKLKDLEEKLAEEERIVDLYEDGLLEEIRETLAEHAELDERIQVAYEERQELEEELQEARHRRQRLENDSSKPSPEEFDLGCRVCGGSVSDETAQSRIDSDCCPLCAREASFDTLLLPDEDDEATEELDEQIAELEEDLQEVEERIERLQSEQPGLGELDDELLRRLNLRNRNVDRLVEKAREEAEELRQKIERCETEIETDEERLEEIPREIEEREARAEELEEEFQSIQREVRDRVIDFQERWTANFETMAPSLAEEIGLNANDGIVVAGDPDRSYHAQDNGLGDAEEQVLCLSFAVTLHETLGDRLPLNALVLDEPFDHLDDRATGELLSFVTEDDDRQYILTTSDDTIVEAFPEDQRRELERDPKKVTLGESTDDD
ncbi:hypothetical protein [Halobaculum sp. MBLA0143]|uniref:hypothetical protein n=1 Tax=Halobaculum sp. MBLA0143 TaxID=3079933 RepID=UPI003525F595